MAALKAEGSSAEPGDSLPIKLEIDGEEDFSPKASPPPPPTPEDFSPVSGRLAPRPSRSSNFQAPESALPSEPGSPGSPGSPDSPWGGRKRGKKASKLSKSSDASPPPSTAVSFWGSELGEMYGLRSETSVHISDFGTDTAKVYQRFKYLRNLGAGKFGTVQEVICRKTQKHFALKIVKAADIAAEISLTKLLRHPYIVSMQEVMTDADDCYLILDLCKGGTLTAWIAHHYETLLHCRLYIAPTSYEIGVFTKQLLLALAYIHHHNIMHRDVKPDNCLLVTPEGSQMKLADFGLSIRFQKGVKMTEVIGTVMYMAPEMSVPSPSYDERCDVWSAGALAYKLATADYVFQDAIDPADFNDADSNKWEEPVFKAMAEAGVKFDPKVWQDFDKGLQQLVQMLLDKNPDQRVRAKEALKNSQWLRRIKVEEKCCCTIS
ncbi:unnamed protein product [Polarella glacialis]|uniref:Protein kinase domain-containing protein n=1 Tax=Polarella glacialis TaxID=89957 RepID=A0A813HQV9_POLGL|nr:unnamed protein product [Polarella glacialis]